MPVKAAQYDGTCTENYCTIVGADLHQNVQKAFLDSNIRVRVNQTVIQTIFNHNYYKTYHATYYSVVESNHIYGLYMVCSMV